MDARRRSFMTLPDGTAVEAFLSADGARLDAVVVYSDAPTKLMVFPTAARGAGEDTLPGDAPTVVGAGDPTV
jgi:hypothetical protein